jgi:hypothetical protein
MYLVRYISVFQRSSRSEPNVLLLAVRVLFNFHSRNIQTRQTDVTLTNLDRLDNMNVWWRQTTLHRPSDTDRLHAKSLRCDLN